jgi:hypothetical protein
VVSEGEGGMTEPFEHQMELIRIIANKAAYSGDKTIRINLTIFLGILSRAEAWTKIQKEKDGGIYG